MKCRESPSEACYSFARTNSVPVDFSGVSGKKKKKKKKRERKKKRENVTTITNNYTKRKEKQTKMDHLREINN